MTHVLLKPENTWLKDGFIEYWALILCAYLAACAKAVAAAIIAPKHILILSLMVMAYMLQNLAIFLIALKCDYSQNKWHHQALDFWDDKIRPEMEALGINFPVEKIRKRQKMYLSISVATCIFGIVLTGVLSFNAFFTIMSLPFPDSIPVVAIFLCAAFIALLIWTFPIEYIIMLCTVLTCAFEAFNRCLEDNISQDIVSKTFQFQRLRKLHLNLGKMVTYLDNDFGSYFAFIFVFNIGFVCLQLYVALKLELDNLALFSILCFGLTYTLALGLVAVFAAWVHEAAHGPLDIIYDVSVKDISTVQLGQLNLFLSKLTGTQIGFTTLGLLTITKEFLLTIAGAFLTYFFLLYTTL